MLFSASLETDSELENESCSDLRCAGEQCTSCLELFFTSGRISRQFKARCKLLCLWYVTVSNSKCRIGQPTHLKRIRFMAEILEDYRSVHFKIDKPYGMSALRIHLSALVRMDKHTWECLQPWISEKWDRTVRSVISQTLNSFVPLAFTLLDIYSMTTGKF